MSEQSSDGKVLVTGATGFVGSHLVDRLIERGRAVRCLVRQTSNLRYLKHPQIELVYGGLDDSTNWDLAFADVDTVYHVAGVTFARRAKDYFAANHKGTETIVAAALKHRSRIKKFVHISSLAAVGPGRDGHPVDEETAPAPITPYGRSKLMGEEAVRAAGELLRATIIRPPAVYGPRDYAIYEFFKSIARGLSPTIGRYDKLVSLVHVHDLVDGIILAGESEASTGRTYFISSEEVYSMQATADLIAKLLGRKARSIAIPRPVAYSVAVAAEAVAAVTRRPPIINRDKVTDLSQTCWGCSIERAKRELGYNQKVPLEEGLRGTIEWYKREGWL
ncbi:MAG TPA: NAD-dependent epimerase/dehydratase family protein [Blastocatellia bacterium]|jgi:nucleoside-diphosphate-sugar epimerase|nr:NAD-dependent epimerase/dehydratase family protein [Blastocatellia bacterium]